jgi:hypothetical protein
MDPVESRKARQTRAVESFWNACKTGGSRLLDEASAWNGSDARHYRAEAAIVMEHIAPIYWGLGVGSFLFITFRVTGSKRFQIFRDSFVYGKPTSSPPKQTQEWKSLLDRQRDEKAELANDLTRLPFDLFVSVTGACSSMLWLSKPDKLQRDFVAAPLLPGKSLIYSTVCPVLEDAYDKHDASVFQGSDAPLLSAFDAFVKNCRIRSEYIERLRQVGFARPDIVPYPGLQGESVR